MRAALICGSPRPHAIAGGGILFAMDGVEPKHSRKRVLHEVSTIIVDGAYASLLAVPVAIGVAAYAFVYLSLLRRRLRRRAEHGVVDRAPAASDAGGD